MKSVARENEFRAVVSVCALAPVEFVYAIPLKHATIFIVKSKNNPLRDYLTTPLICDSLPRLVKSKAKG